MSDNIQQLLINAFQIQTEKINELNLNVLDYEASPASISQEEQQKINIVDTFMIDIKKLIEEKIPDSKTFKEVLKIKKNQLNKTYSIMFAFDDMITQKKAKEIDAYASLDKMISTLICDVQLLNSIDYIIPHDPNITDIKDNFDSGSDSEYDSDGSY